LLLLSIVLQFTGRIAARPVLLISAVCLALASYALSFHFNMRPLHYRAVKLRNSSYCHYRCDKAYDYMYPLQDQAEFILWKSEFLGIYTMPEYKGDYFCH
jgi:hypothetical protein